MNKGFLLKLVVMAIILVVGVSTVSKVDAYYGMMGGLYGMSGMYGGMMGGMMSPFSLSNMYYPISTGSGLSYQVPFMQIAPMLGMAGLYSQLFPSIFNSSSSQVPTAATSVAPLATSITVL